MIEDRYQLIDQVGSGGMSLVWKAHDTVLGRTVAVKRLHPSLVRDPEAARRFEREAQAAARLSHPGIITVFDTGQDADGAYIVLEYIEGPNLAQILGSEGPLDAARAAHVARQVAAAIDYSHAQGVIHRDIKPSNLMIDPDGSVRVADFGIAKTMNALQTHTDIGEMKGTISYMAPELLDGQPASPASDIYSLGAVTYEMLAGSPPYAGESVGATVAAIQANEMPDFRGLAAENAAAIRRALARDPADRHQTATEFATALTVGMTLPLGFPVAAVESRPTGSEEPTRLLPATSPPPPARKRSWPPRAWAPVAVLALGALLLLALAMRPPASPDDNLAAATSTTTRPTTTSPAVGDVTTGPDTSTTTSTITPVVNSPDAIAGEISSTLAGLRPPEFKMKDVKDVGKELDHAMQAWEEDDEDKMADELEKAIDAVFKLPESSQQDQLLRLFERLAEAMGLDLEDVDDH